MKASTTTPSNWQENGCDAPYTHHHRQHNTAETKACMAMRTEWTLISEHKRSAKVVSQNGNCFFSISLLYLYYILKWKFVSHPSVCAAFSYPSSSLSLSLPHILIHSSSSSSSIICCLMALLLCGTLPSFSSTFTFAHSIYISN